MEQEPNYFTPSIEDIHVGYEFEAFLANPKKKDRVWKPQIYENKWVDKYLDFEYMLKEGRIRVPYLTKEQIEKEGWKKQGSNKFYEKHKNSKIYYLWVTENRISINEGMFGLLYWKVPQIYRGECKDINTFRHISKLLNI